MACFSLAGPCAMARMPTSTACSLRPFETMRATLGDARSPSFGFISRRVKPLRHTHSIWIDETRRHGRVLRDTRNTRHWVMASSNENMPSEDKAYRKAYVPKRCVLPFPPLFRFLLPKLCLLTKLF